MYAYNIPLFRSCSELYLSQALVASLLYTKEISYKSSLSSIIYIYYAASLFRKSIIVFVCSLTTLSSVLFKLRSDFFSISKSSIYEKLIFIRNIHLFLTLLCTLASSRAFCCERMPLNIKVPIPIPILFGTGLKCGFLYSPSSSSSSSSSLGREMGKLIRLTTIGWAAGLAGFDNETMGWQKKDKPGLDWVDVLMMGLAFVVMEIELEGAFVGDKSFDSI